LEDAWLPQPAADAAGVAEPTIYRWLARYRAEGEAEEGEGDRAKIGRMQGTASGAATLILAEGADGHGGCR
jgi:hypothetical protein